MVTELNTNLKIKLIKTMITLKKVKINILYSLFLNQSNTEEKN